MLTVNDISTTCVVVTFGVKKMTTAQVVEMSVTVNNNSPIQDYLHRDNQTQYIDSCLNLLTMDTVFNSLPKVAVLERFKCIVTFM